ncbi:MAG: molecular chaperone [Haloferacaceae archaeon]
MSDSHAHDANGTDEGSHGATREGPGPSDADESGDASDAVPSASVDDSPAAGLDDGDAALDDPTYHGARAAAYGVAAAAFLYPDEPTLSELRAPETVEGLSAAADRLGGPVAAAAEDLLAALERVDGDALRGAHTDLFGVPDDGGTYPVAPYETAYTVAGGGDHEQRRIAAVAGLLEAFDLDRGEDFDERHDHVAVELELMQVLAAKRAVALDADESDLAATMRDAEATVVEGHLAEFVPSLSADLRDALDDRGADDGAAALLCAAATLAERLVERDAATHPSDVPTPDSVAAAPGGELP